MQKRAFKEAFSASGPSAAESRKFLTYLQGNAPETAHYWCNELFELLTVEYVCTFRIVICTTCTIHISQQLLDKFGEFCACLIYGATNRAFHWNACSNFPVE